MAENEITNVSELINNLREEKDLCNRTIDIFKKLPRDLWYGEFQHMISESPNVEFGDHDITIDYNDDLWNDTNSVWLQFQLEQLTPGYVFPYAVGDFVEPVESDGSNVNDIWMVYWLPRLDSRLPQEEDCPTRWMDFGNIYEIVQVTKNFGDIYWIEIAYQSNILKPVSYDDPRITDFMKECRRQRILENYSLFKAKNSEYWTAGTFDGKDHHWN